MLKKGKKGQNIRKFGRKCTKFENILKECRWLLAIIAGNKLLEKTQMTGDLIVKYRLGHYFHCLDQAYFYGRILAKVKWWCRSDKNIGHPDKFYKFLMFISKSGRFCNDKFIYV